MALGTDPRGASSVLFGVPIFLFSFLKDQRHHFPFIGFCSYTVIGYISCRSKYLILLWMNQSYWVVVLFTQFALDTPSENLVVFFPDIFKSRIYIFFRETNKYFRAKGCVNQRPSKYSVLSKMFTNIYQYYTIIITIFVFVLKTCTP